MKSAMVTALLVFLAPAAQAATPGDYGAMVQRHSPACSVLGPRIERTAAVPGACCAGAACGQMLATTKVDRPRAASHT